MCDLWWWLGWQSESTEQVLDRLRTSLQREWRTLETEARNLADSAGKVPALIRKELKAGNRNEARTFAVEMARMYQTRARVIACQNRINEARATLRQGKANLKLGRAMVDMTRVLQGLASMDETRQICATLSREMLKAGVIQQEMMDALEPDLDPEQEEEADAMLGDIELVDRGNTKKAAPHLDADAMQSEADRLIRLEEEFIRTGKRPTQQPLQTAAAPDAD